MERLALKESLGIDPQADGAVFLGPKKIAVTRIVEDIRQTVNAGRFPKKVIVGVFGIGKTHFIYYAMNKLSDVIYPLYVEVPPTHRRSRFTDVYGVVLRRLGKEQIMNLLSESIKVKSKILVTEPELTSVITESTSEDSLKFVLWKFLSGSKLTSSELREIGLGHAGIYEDEAVWILNVIGDAIMRREQKPLVLFFDEFDNTASIQGDSYTMFTEAIRGMVDESSRLGVLFIASGREVADYPATIMEEPVRRRIGAQNYITFKEYTSEELLQFAQDVLVYRRKEESNFEKIVKESKTTEEVSTRTFPFTRQALEYIIQTINNLRMEGKIPSLRPSDTLNFMSICVQELLATRGSTVIDSNFAKTVLEKRAEYISGEKEVTV